MDAATEDTVAAYPHSNAWHLIGALLLAGLLVVLPLFGIGPTTGRDRPAAADPRPMAKSAPVAPTAPAPSAAPAAPAATPPVPPAPQPAVIAAPAPATSASSAAVSAAAEPAPAPSTATSLAAVAAAPVPPRAVIYFEFDDDDPPADAPQRLAPIVAYLKSETDAKVQISGYHDASGNRIYNQDLAARREVAVRGALERAGIRRDRIVIARPVETAGSGKPQQARRTEVTILR